MKKTSTLVAGGAGFIGSYLCEALLEKGHHVICVDNLCTSKDSNISHLLDNENFEFVNQDIKSPLDFDTNHVFHLASPPSPVDFQKIPIKILMTNSFGTHNILELVRKNKAKLLFTSTSEVYGDPKEHPQKETYYGNVNPVGPRSSYDEGKRFSEALTMAYQRKYNLDLRITRIFNTFGPRMRPDDGRAIPTFVVQALSGKPITVYGDGSQTRSFCFVSDMVNGLMKFMFTDNLSGEVINLGNPEEVTILHLAERIKKLTGSRSEITFLELPQDDPVRRKPDISKAKKLLNWEPQVTFNDGLQQTIEWFKK